MKTGTSKDTIRLPVWEDLALIGCSAQATANLHLATAHTHTHTLTQTHEHSRDDFLSIFLLLD